MTRLRTQDIERIVPELDSYDRHLLDRTGKNLKGLACHAVGLLDRRFEDIVGSLQVGVVPMTCGQGVIPGFCDTVRGIVDHLGFPSFVAETSDAGGIAEAFERRADVLILADDDRFVAVHVRTKRVCDNTRMTAQGFVAGLDRMAGGLRGKRVLAIGCGGVGREAAMLLARMGVGVSVCDIRPEATRMLQTEIRKEMNIAVEIEPTGPSTCERYRYIIDATPSVDVIDAPAITAETFVAVPGVPCGLTPQARKSLGNRYLHDPLQIGVATMVVDACKHEWTETPE